MILFYSINFYIIKYWIHERLRIFALNAKKKINNQYNKENLSSRFL